MGDHMSCMMGPHSMTLWRHHDALEIPLQEEDTQVSHFV